MEKIKDLTFGRKLLKDVKFNLSSPLHIGIIINQLLKIYLVRITRSNRLIKNKMPTLLPNSRNSLLNVLRAEDRIAHEKTVEFGLHPYQGLLLTERKRAHSNNDDDLRVEVGNFDELTEEEKTDQKMIEHLDTLQLLLKRKNIDDMIIFFDESDDDKQYIKLLTGSQ